jgi:beta-N-acetylhexosaminidase
VHALVQKLQQMAKSAGHERPLMIGTDQENGLAYCSQELIGKLTTKAGLVSAFSVAHSDEAGTQLSV